jgi:dTDP-glucose pyrophosphorylase
MNLLIPAAGDGTRFAQAGYKALKPFIHVDGKPMVQHVLDLGPDAARRVVVLKEEVQPPTGIDPDVMFLHVPPVEAARGAAGTILYAAKMLPINEPVVVINCDNVIAPHGGWDYWLDDVPVTADVCIVTWRVDADDPNRAAYSYVDPVRTARPQRVRNVAEKQVLSEYACAGAFYFKDAAMLIAACTLELEFGAMVKGEHYLAPSISQLLARGAEVYHVPLDSGSIFVRMGTPEDMEHAVEELNRVR